MANTFRIVPSDIYREHLFENRLSITERYFYLYLLTNPQTNQIGIYSLSKGLIAYDMQLDAKDTADLFHKFEHEYQLIRYNHETSEIAVLYSLTGSIVTGGKPVTDLLTKELSHVKSTALIQEVNVFMLNFWNNSERNYDQVVAGWFQHELTKRAQNQPNESSLRVVPSNDNETEKDNDNDDVNDNVMTMTLATNKESTPEENSEPTETFDQGMTLPPEDTSPSTSDHSPETDSAPQAEEASLSIAPPPSGLKVTFGQFGSKLSKKEIKARVKNLDVTQELQLLMIHTNYPNGLSDRQKFELVHASHYLSPELVEEASNRSKLAEDPYPYTLTILQNWYNAGVKTMDEVKKLDKMHKNTYQNAQAKPKMYVEVVPEWMQQLADQETQEDSQDQENK